MKHYHAVWNKKLTVNPLLSVKPKNVNHFLHLIEEKCSVWIQILSVKKTTKTLRVISATQCENKNETLSVNSVTQCENKDKMLSVNSAS